MRVRASAPAHPALIILIPPLFDESNRLRRTLKLTMHELAAHGHDSWLPDLPGQNDSLIPTEEVTLDDWRRTFAAICADAARPVVSAAWRAGALIDSAADIDGRWRMAPQNGASLVRTLARARVAGEREAGRPTTLDALQAHMRANITEVAGNHLSPLMVQQLEPALIEDRPQLRTVTIGTGGSSLAGTPLWLRAEPDEDPAMAEVMAADIAAWAKQCVAG